MQTEEIKIRVRPEVAEAYRNASPEKQAKIRALITVWVNEPEEDFEAATDALERVMDEIGARARERGLTDDILRDILNEE